MSSTPMYEVASIDRLVRLFRALFGSASNRRQLASAQYVREQFLSAVADQKSAIRLECGLDVTQLPRNVRVFEAQGGANSIEDSSATFNEGWLAAFYRGLDQIEKDIQNQSWLPDASTKEGYLVQFLDDQLELSRAIYRDNPTTFNQGGVDAYQGWLDGLDGGWVDY